MVTSFLIYDSNTMYFFLCRMETSSLQEKDMQVNVGVSPRIDFDFPENVITIDNVYNPDNVQTPIACGRVNSSRGFEAKVHY